MCKSTAASRQTTKFLIKLNMKKNKTYQPAEDTQSQSRIKFKLFNFISTNWLKHRNVKLIRLFYIAVDEFAFIKTLPPQRNKRIHRFNWSKSQLWRCRFNLCEIIKWSKYGFFQRCCTINKKYFDHKVQFRWKNMKICVRLFFLIKSRAHEC